MRSPLLALFIRSLRQDMRSGATYWARAGLGAFFLLVLLFFALTSSWMGAPGRGFFISIITLQMVSITFVGLSYFASAIAEEKEEQTLGLLRMTGLDPLSILLGKSTSRLCGALLFVTAQIPFTIFAITLGGVSLRQIEAAYCTLLAFTFLLCNLALLGSVVARRTAGAVAFCLCTPVVLGLVWGLLVSLQDFLSYYYQLHWHYQVHRPLDRIAAIIASASPISRLQEVLGTGFSGAPIGRQVIIDVVFGTGFFLLAWALFERLCDRTSDRTFVLNRLPPAARNAARGVLRRVSLSWLLPPRPGKKALLWKDYYFLHGGRVAFLIRLVAYGVTVLANAWSFLTAGGPRTAMGTSTIVNSILPIFFSIDLAVTAGRVFRVEIDEQTLATLAILPCSMREIFHRKLLACLLVLAPGAICVIADQMLFLGFAGEQRLLVFTATLNGWVQDILMGFVVIWLSLYLKRGAAPLGWVLTHVLNGMLVGICGLLISLAIMALSRGGQFTQWFVSMVSLGPALSAVVGLGAAWIMRRAGLVKLEEMTREN